MASDIMIKFAGVEGESTMEGYKGWIECESFSEGLSSSASVSSGTGGAVGKPTIHPFSFSAIQGKHTAALKQKQLDGTHFEKLDIHFMKQVAANILKPYYTIELKTVFVTGLHSSRGKDSLAHESVTIDANEIKWEYFTQDNEGNLASNGAQTYNVQEAKSS